MEQRTVKIEYTSILAPYINGLLRVKEAAGYNMRAAKHVFKELDVYVASLGVTEPVLTEEIISGWAATRINDRKNTLYAKYALINQLSRYIIHNGGESYVPRLPRYPNSDFTPYIFTEKEISDILAKADTLVPKTHYENIMVIPAILRLLYATGMRISEALSLTNRDVDTDNGILLIRNTKNQQDRKIPIKGSLVSVLVQYRKYRDMMPLKHTGDADKLFFIKPDGSSVSPGCIYTRFRKIYTSCGIKYVGDQRGPRVHDLRHTFAVHTLAAMSRAGIDLYTSMPILSVYLGHKSIWMTEKYVRLTTSMYPEIETKCTECDQLIYPIDLE
ncbi:MAG: tyrosine-type recombinase/integrase [Lachnospiraceae bacterium]|nr:tyrosine-type recombinase/integrase [Lachnospiraceae bacterium]